VDAAAFEAHCQAAVRLDEAGQAEMAARHWRQAATLYRGEYMAGLDTSFTEDYVEGCCHWRRFRLNDLHLTSLLKLAHYHFGRAEDHLSQTYAQQALDADRCSEDGHRLIMKLRHRAGQFDEMARQYRQCERSLNESEGRCPAPETTRLYQQLQPTLEAPT
jgi:DNA-binding SARP family transcriptional activator